MHRPSSCSKVFILEGVMKIVCGDDGGNGSGGGGRGNGDRSGVGQNMNWYFV